MALPFQPASQRLAVVLVVVHDEDTAFAMWARVVRSCRRRRGDAARLGRGWLQLVQIQRAGELGRDGCGTGVVASGAAAAGRSVGKLDGERGPLALLALHGHVAAHHLAEALRDRQPQARAAVLARRAGVGLAEFLEEPRHLVRRHADAGVRDTPADTRPRRQRDALRLQRDRPLLGKLAGIAEQVEQALPDAGYVRVDRRRQVPAAYL